MIAPTLTDFLLARIAEDEFAAKAATPGPWEGYYDDSSNPYWGVVTAKMGDQVASHELWRLGGYDERHGAEGADAYHIARHNPARVLAECEAKRRLIALHETVQGEPRHREVFCAEDATTRLPCASLRLLALPYADHPDYRQEWRP